MYTALSLYHHTHRNFLYKQGKLHPHTYYKQLSIAKSRSSYGIIYYKFINVRLETVHTILGCLQFKSLLFVESKRLIYDHVYLQIRIHEEPTEVRSGEMHYNMEKGTWETKPLLEVG